MSEVEEFDVITLMNATMFKLKTDKGLDCKENIDIREKLKDRAYFFKASMIDSFRLLLLVGVAEKEVEATYKRLTTSKTYFKLLDKGLINENDNLTVKYNKVDENK